MAKSKILESKIPWFISIPRCGSNWIQGMMDIYFEKPHGPIIEEKHKFFKRYRWYYPEGTTEEDFLYIAHHDQQGFDIQPSTSKEGDVFLYRNPMDCVYSNVQRDKGSSRRMQYFIHEYKRTFDKWVVGGRAKLIIKYEDMVEEPEKTFKKLVEHFNFPWNKEKFKKAHATVTKRSLVDKAPDRRDIAYTEMMSEKYANDRIEFRKKHTSKLKNDILTEENKPWLGCYFEE